MGKSFLKFTAMGYRDVMGRFTKRTQTQERERRRAGREMARETLKELQAQAPEKTGVFKDGLFFRTYDRGHRMWIRFYAGGPHAFVLPFLLEGTRPHIIPTGGAPAQLAKGYPLRFWWEKGPAGPGVYHYWSVNHPGTDPDPFADRTAEIMEPRIRDRLQKVAGQVARVS